MTRGIRLFTYRNIPVFLHWSFGFIIFYIAYIAHSSNLNIVGTAWLSTIFSIFFLCVILHEFGHALTARRYGISSKDIVLTPIGGVARLLRIPKNPRQELAIAIAGPLVNIVIALFISLFIFRVIPDFLHRYEPIDMNKLSFKEFLFIVCIGNVFLAIFNLIPAFPMDGGRILRALLAFQMPRLQATKWATYIGRFFALGFIVYGVFFSNYILAFIGIFVFMSAGAEYRFLKKQASRKDLMVRKHFEPDPILISKEELIINLNVRNLDKPMLVLDMTGSLCGIFHTRYIEDNAAEMKSSVKEHAIYKIIPIQLDDHISKALFLMQSNEVDILPVYDDDQLVGTLYLPDLANKKLIH